MTHEPAFPVVKTYSNFANGRIYCEILSPGMTLRDWFAGQVLIGYVMADPLRNNPDKIAAYAYQNADAMLREREK